MNRYPVKKLFSKNKPLFLFVILFMISLLSNSATAAEAPIINGNTKMAPGGNQILSIMNYRTGTTYTWSKLSGGGFLNASSGESVIFTAPTSNPNCNNPIIQVVDSNGNKGSLTIAINSYASGVAYVECGNSQSFSVSLYGIIAYGCNGQARGDISSFFCNDCTYFKQPVHPDTPCITFWGKCSSSGYAVGINDVRTAQMINGGCCPEELLPGYESKKAAPFNVDFGIDPDAKYPVCQIDKVGNPISVFSGNNFESQTDLSFPSPGGKSFDFKRFYNSRTDTTADIGYGWTHSYRVFLNTDFKYEGLSYLKIIDETGRNVYFTNQGGGLYSGAFKEQSHVMTQGGSYVWHRPDGRRFLFDANRSLIRIEEPSGHYRTLNYDAASRLNAVVDEAGNRTLTFVYNSAGRIESISGPYTEAVKNGIWVHYGYDASGNLISATYADQSGFDYIYKNPADHNLTAKKDKQGHLLSSWSYDGQDRVISNFTRDGKGVSITYVSDNEVRVTDAYGVTRTFTIWDIDGRKKVTEINAPSDCATCSDDIKRVEYDSLGRIIEIEYVNGRIDQFDDFDSRGNAHIFKKAVGTPDEKTIRYTFHPDIGATFTKTEESILGAGDKFTVWDYDDDGNNLPIQNPTRRVYRLSEHGFTKDADGKLVTYDRITAYTYNSRGQILTVDGPGHDEQDTTTFTYDASSGNLLTTARALGGVVSYSDYDGAGQAGRSIDENGQVTLYTYDGFGRILTITRVDDGASAVFNYNTAGNLYEIIDPDGISTAFAYDSVYGRLTYLEDPLGNYLYYGYDIQGNIVEQSIHASAVDPVYLKRFNYHGLQHPGKLWKEINPDNTYVEYSYTAGGNIRSITDPAGKTTFYDYDLMNRLTGVIQPGNAMTFYFYDRHDNLALVTDAESHQTIYEYDDLGRLLKTDSPDTGITTYAYDFSGNLISKTDSKGIKIHYAYDVINRLTAIHYPDSIQNVFFSYDQGHNGMGRLTGIQNPSGNLSYGYDQAGRIIRETRTINGFEFITLYAYSPAGRVRQITYPEGRMVRYDYDAAGRIERVINGLEGVETVLADEIVHLPFGPIASLRFGNSLDSSSIFDRLYRPESLQAGAVLNRSLSYDPGGNISAIENLLDPARSQWFSYDDLNHLIAAEGIYGAIGYTYDRVGNRLSKSHSGVSDVYRYIPGTSRLSEVGGTSYSYDPNGNPTEVGTSSFNYNQNNRLILAAKNGLVLGEYLYNALGQRVVKRKDSQTTLFIYDQQGNLMAEADGKGNITQEYIWLEGRLLAGVKSGKRLIEAILEMAPDTLNLDSHGNWVTAYITLPQGFDVTEIDPATILLNRSVYADRVEVGDFDSDGIPDLMVKFSRSLASAILSTSDAVEIEVEGEADEFRISGTDTIRVISKGDKYKKWQGTAIAARAVSTLSTASKSSRLVFYHLDHLGTPQVITDENGEIVWSADYLPFGEVNVTTNAVGNEFRFPGQYYDAETGLHYNYHRYYDPKNGRYLTPDPIGLAGGMNLYDYVINNPVIFIDPLGLVHWKTVFKGTTSFVFGAAAVLGGATAASTPTGIGQVLGFAGALAGSSAISIGISQIIEGFIDEELPFMGIREAIIQEFTTGLTQKNLLAANELLEIIPSLASGGLNANPGHLQNALSLIKYSLSIGKSVNQIKNELKESGLLESNDCN